MAMATTQWDGTSTILAHATSSPRSSPPSCHALVPPAAARYSRPLLLLPHHHHHHQQQQKEKQKQKKQQQKQQSTISTTFSTVSCFCFFQQTASSRLRLGHSQGMGTAPWGMSSAAVMELTISAVDWRASISPEESCVSVIPEVKIHGMSQKITSKTEDSPQTVNGFQQHSETLNAPNSDGGSSQRAKCEEVLSLLRKGKVKDAFDVLDSISDIDEFVISTYDNLLHECGKRRAIVELKKLHALALKHQFLSNKFIGSSFVNVYAKLGMLTDAQKVFDFLPIPNGLAWNALVSGYAKFGSFETAGKLYHNMKLEGFEPSKLTFVLMLNSCANKQDIQIGKKIHADARKYDHECDVLVGSALVTMYGKCGDLETARLVFDNMPEKNVVCWNAIISAFAKKGKGHETLKLYGQMKRVGLKPSDFTFVYVLKACASLADVELGKQIHADIIHAGIRLNVFLGTALMDMYAKCGNMTKAQELFDEMPTRNDVSFAAMISGYCKNHNHKEAIRCFTQMRKEGLTPHVMTFVSVLHACSLTEALEEGKQIHADLIECGYETNIYAATALVDMYCKCHRIPLAREIFDKMPGRTVVPWTAIIAAYARNAAGDEALKLYDQMKKEGIKPEYMTSVFVLNACASTGNLEMGKKTHAEILEAGFDSVVIVGCALIDMYSKCGSLADSRMVFDRMPNRNEYTWTSMIAGYAKHGDYVEAIRLYRQMKLDGLKPDVWTFVCILNVCVQIGSLECGKEVHDDIRKGGYETDATIKKALSSMYFKCGGPEITPAQEVLQQA